MRVRSTAVKPIFTSLIVTSLMTSLSTFAKQTCTDIENEVWSNNQCTKIETYKSTQLTSSPALAIILHGDAHNYQPAEQYRIAQKLASQQKNVVAVGMLRPGYTDDWGRTSDGRLGDTVGDNYDDETIKQIALAIQALKQQHNASKVVVLGHYGGATILGRLLGIYPNLVDSAVLASCNCNINAWRATLYERLQLDVLKDDLDTKTPMELAKQVSDKTKISLIVGKDDERTGPRYSREYYDSLKKNGKQVSLQLIDGNHYIFNNDIVLNTVSNALKL